MHLTSSSFAYEYQPLIIERSGVLLEEIAKIKQQVLVKASFRYHPPNSYKLGEFDKITRAIFHHKWLEASILARDINYELIKFHDFPSGQTFFEFKEKSGIHQRRRGWGTYFYNPAYEINTAIEAPHVLFDRFSAEIATDIFVRSKARALLLSGAHRHANGHNSADVCHLPTSMFQTFHQVGVNNAAKTLQIHGFSRAKQADLPADTEVVISNGSGQNFPLIQQLQQELRKFNFPAYIYERSQSTAPENKNSNSLKPNPFRNLAGRKNYQGQYSREHNQTFIHLELAQAVRFSIPRRRKIARVIANYIGY